MAFIIWYGCFNVLRWFQKKEIYFDTVVWSYRYEPNGPNIGRNILFVIYVLLIALLSWGCLFVFPQHV
jgi:hypothetical protein